MAQDMPENAKRILQEMFGEDVDLEGVEVDEETTEKLVEMLEQLRDDPIGTIERVQAAMAMETIAETVVSITKKLSEARVLQGRLAVTIAAHPDYARLTGLLADQCEAAHGAIVDAIRATTEMFDPELLSEDQLKQQEGVAELCKTYKRHLRDSMLIHTTEVKAADSAQNS